MQQLLFFLSTALGEYSFKTQSNVRIFFYIVTMNENVLDC